VSFIIVEAGDRIGGRLKTDVRNGFLLNHGFQVLQTAYPKACRQLDYHCLELKPFAPGAIIRVAGKFMRVSDPRRRPRDIWRSLTAPVEIKDNNGNNSDQTADMLFFDTASVWRLAPGIICEEIAMALLDVGILMVARSRHEGDVSFQKIVCVVGAVLVDRVNEQPANFDG
jgi:hypothetical protein